MFSAMSYGSISYNAHAALARAAEELGILYNTGEGDFIRTFANMAKIQLYRSHQVVLVLIENTSILQRLLK